MFYNRIIFVPFFLHFPFPFPPSKASHIFFLSLLEIHGLFQNNAVTCIYIDISKCSLLGLYNVACMYVSGMTTWYWITNWCPLFPPAQDHCCSLWIWPSHINQPSRKFPTDMPRGQSDGGDSPVEDPSSLVHHIDNQD